MPVGKKANGRIRTGRFGPGFVITAAFIGPGTVITCSSAGISFGVTLIWCLLLAGIMAFVMQEMSVRLGLGSGSDLASMLRQISERRWIVLLLGATVAVSICLGCIAYQAGNLLGGAAGIANIFGGDLRIWVLAQCAVATLLLWTGKYKHVEKFLLVLVAIMSVCFIMTAAVFFPNPSIIIGQLINLSVPLEAFPMILALIGTTVVPYNLFLHSKIVREKWLDKSNIGWARRDLFAAVLIGIAVSMAIMISLAGLAERSGGTEEGIANIADLVRVVRGGLGETGVGIFGMGLWAAGMTSAITAPLAAAYTVAGLAGWTKEDQKTKFRMIWLAVMASGIIFAITSTQPVMLIMAAQALNGLMLPLVSVLLLIALNNKKKMGSLRNSFGANIITFLIVLIITVLSCRALMGVVDTVRKAFGSE